MQADYDYVMNLVPSDNYRTISWLKYCKFEFSTEKKIYNGYELLSFYRCNKFKSSIYNESSRPVMH